MAICLGMQPIKDGSDITGAEMLRKVMSEYTPQEKIGSIRVGLRKKAKDYFYCTRTHRVGIGTFST